MRSFQIAKEGTRNTSQRVHYCYGENGVEIKWILSNVPPLVKKTGVNMKLSMKIKEYTYNVQMLMACECTRGEEGEKMRESK